MEKTTEVVKTGMEAVTAAMATVTTVVGNVFTVLTSNPYTTFLLAAGLVGVGIGVFRSLKGAAKH